MKMLKMYLNLVMAYPKFPVHLLHIFHMLIITLHVIRRWLMVSSYSPHITQLILF